MGKKKTAEEKVNAAREKGFDDDMTGINDRPVLRGILLYTKGLYDVQMEVWREYERDHPGADPRDLRTIKHFAELLASAADGGIEEKPTEATVRGYMRRFTSGYERHTGICIPEHIRRSATNHIKTLGLSTAHRPRHYLTLKKFKILVSVVWENDWHEFDHEGARVGYNAKLNFFCFSSARLGELTESSAKAGTGKGLHYRDIVMLIGWGLDGRPEIQMSMKRAAAKGMHNSRSRPEHPMFETTTGLPLLFNPILFFLAIALASGAFKDYQTADQIFALEPPEHDDHWILEWADEIQDVPVFQAMSCNGPTGKIQKSGPFARQLSSAAQRAGFKNVTIHDARREGLVKANANGYSAAELMKFAGQSGSDVFQKFYMAEGSVDGQNSFLNQPLRKDHVESFRGITLQCNPELQQSLPAHMQDKLERRPDFVALEEQIEELTEEMKKVTNKEAIQELQSRRYQLYKARRRLTLEELKRCRESQPRNHPSHGDNGPSEGDHHRDFFNRVRHMIPERDRLSRDLFKKVQLRSSEGRAVLQDLIALYKDDCRVAYQSVLRPISGRCPVSSCALPIESIRIADRWNHVYRCYEADLKERYGFAMFCFKCSEWISSKADWELHCQGHIDRSEMPSRCDPLLFRYALASAGHCPRCLHNSQRPAAERMYQFTNRARWLQHVQRCVQQNIQSIDRTDAVPCPYGLPCNMILESDQHVWPHLQDHHSINMPNSGKKRRFDAEIQSDTSRAKSDTDNPKRPRLQGKRHTTTFGPKSNLDGCHEIKSKLSNDGMRYDFVSYSVTDLEASSSSYGGKDSSNVISTTSIQDTTNGMRIYGRYSPPAHTVTLDKIDPQLLSQETVSPVQYETICSNTSPIALPAPHKQSIPVVSRSAHHVTSARGTKGVEVEDYKSFDEENTHLLENEHPQDQTTILDKDKPKLPSVIVLLPNNDIVRNTGEPVADLRDPECPPARKNPVQVPEPAAIVPDDDQYTVERLLERQVVPKGKGKRRRMATEYWVKWQGWPDKYNEWVNENDIHVDLIAAYNLANS